MQGDQRSPCKPVPEQPFSEILQRFIAVGHNFQRPMNRATTTACGRGIPAPMRRKGFVVNADLRSLLKCVTPTILRNYCEYNIEANRLKVKILSTVFR